jgi:NAD(P)-dependent dehydrogenase (short-subunit alcohol dehydrogenase family)
MAGADAGLDRSLAGKVALITGAGSGIGLATARLFAAHGATVALVDIDPVRGEAESAAIRSNGGHALFVQADVSRPEDCSRAIDQVLRESGALDVLFNNAGIIRRASVVETSEADWDRVMDVNVKSMFLMSRHAIPSMRAGSAIVNTASGWGLAGGARAAAYCASKGAVVLLTKAMAIDCGPLGIRVNCICPGDTDTAMLRDEAAQLGEAEDRFLSGAASRPLGRVGRPEEIADAVLYLAGPRSTFVTGTALVVDGGGLAGSI